MKKFKFVHIQYVIITFLIIYPNYTTGQSKNINENHIFPKQNSAIQIDSLKSTTYSVDKNIRSIFQDKKGNYWFGTNGAGVFLYDSKTLTQFTVKDGLADNQVINIQEDDMGNLWFGSSTFGISKFDGKNFTTESNKFLITHGTQIEWGSKTNDLLFYAGGGVFRYSDSSLEYLPFDTLGSKAKTHTPFSLSRYGVYCILKDKKGNIWFGTQSEGVCRYDGETLTWFKEKGLAGPAVLGLFEDSKGRIWFGNNGAGLFRYEGNSLTKFTEERGLHNADFRAPGKPGAGNLARVYAINEDNNGNIWIGTVDAGVWKYDGINLINYTTRDGLTSNAVNTIYKDKYGELWFGTDGNGICKFNGKTFTGFIIK
jgi:ligand-binding sensor domain-containing protein